MGGIMKAIYVYLVVVIVSSQVAISETQCADGPDCNHCIHGYYGQQCDLQCPTNCDSGCHRTYGHCDHACVLTYWGRFCEHRCPSNCTEGCNQTTGSCHGGCSPGLYGVFCNMSCSDDCAVCLQTDGECVQLKADEGRLFNCKDIHCRYCREGLRGHKCTSPCPEHCSLGCDKTSGECKECAIGYHGNYCSKSCTITCKEGCNQTDGSCRGGCHIGWYGRFCNESCSNTCIGGKCYQISGDCDIGVVKNVHTLTLSHCTSMWTGLRMVKNCSAGCESGWRGARCDQICPEECHTCSRYPDDHICIYRREVLVVRTYEVINYKPDEVGSRVITTLALTIVPFSVLAVAILSTRCCKA